MWCFLKLRNFPQRKCCHRSYKESWHPFRGIFQKKFVTSFPRNVPNVGISFKEFSERKCWYLSFKEFSERKCWHLSYRRHLSFTIKWQATSCLCNGEIQLYTIAFHCRVTKTATYDLQITNVHNCFSLQSYKKQQNTI